jgi:hypothetical protein
MALECGNLLPWCETSYLRKEPHTCQCRKHHTYIVALAFATCFLYLSHSPTLTHSLTHSLTPSLFLWSEATDLSLVRKCLRGMAGDKRTASRRQGLDEPVARITNFTYSRWRRKRHRMRTWGQLCSWICFSTAENVIQEKTMSFISCFSFYLTLNLSLRISF